MTNIRTRTVALLAAVSTWLFWIEYLPPFKRAHLHSDIDGFHWPLLMSAFEAIRHGRFPLWDPSMYCGIPFAGNIQASLFYPPTWLLFAANVRSRHVLITTVEAWVFLHAWLAFVLCYAWLRGRRPGPLASALGAAGFAFGGYMVSQNTHVGMVTGYAWTPLAWIGIDQAIERRSWRPMWKVVAASALCFLAGYPSSFAAFAIATAVYAAARSWRAGIAAVAAIAASLAVAAVQLLPAAEASGMKSLDAKYGPGILDPIFYVHFLTPDWVGIKYGDPYLYFYLGVPALFGIVWFIRRPDRAALAVLGVCALFMTNPGGLLSKLIVKSEFLVQVFPQLSFVEPATLVFAFIAAAAIDRFLEPGKRRSASWFGRREFAFAAAGLLAGWAAYRMWSWTRQPAGWQAVAETGVLLALFVAGLLAVRGGRGWVAVALVAAVFADYKAAGTSRPFSAMSGDVESVYKRGEIPGLEQRVYDILLENRPYRLALDGIHPTDMRRYGLATPQGFDPLVPAQYKAAIERIKPFETNRLFQIAPKDEELMQLLGVRYFLTFDAAQFPAVVASDPNFRLVGRNDYFIKVYEYLKAKPPWRWEGGARVERWEPELREFRLNSTTGGRFVLIEQFYPGWSASVDGRPVPIERWGGSFQSIAAPAGSHVARFEYRPASVRLGAAISAASLLALGVWLWRTRPRPR